MASDAVTELKAIADQLDMLNARLEAENKRLKAAILLLTECVDEILPYVITDADVISRARAANEAARLTVSS